MLCMGSIFSQQRFKNIHTEVEYSTEKEINLYFLDSSDDLYQLNLLSGKHSDLDFQLRVRMEDELSSEEEYKLSEMTFLDLQVNFQIGVLGVRLAIENLINFNNRDFAIEGSLEKDFGGFQTVYFGHEADFLLSTALTYNF